MMTGRSVWLYFSCGLLEVIWIRKMRHNAAACTGTAMERCLRGVTGKDFEETKEQGRYFWQLHCNGLMFSLYSEAVQLKGEDASMKRERVSETNTVFPMDGQKKAARLDEAWNYSNKIQCTWWPSMFWFLLTTSNQWRDAKIEVA